MVILHGLRRYYFSFFFLVAIFLMLIMSSKAQNENLTEKRHGRIISFGAIIDTSTREGKEQGIAMKIAIEDFYSRSGRLPCLRISNSRGDPIRAAYSARRLIKKHQVNAILGFRACLESFSVAEIGNKSKIPILSLANDLPQWSSSRWPFLVKAARDQHSQMKVIAAIIRSWQWRKVNIIYEDINSAATDTIPNLITAIQDVDSYVDNIVSLPPMASYIFTKRKLTRLKNGQTRVFIVHTSIKLANNIFILANKLGLMRNESVWITTEDITNHIDTLDAKSFSSMQGVLGIKSYIPQSKKLKHFQSKFISKFSVQHPMEAYSNPGIFAVQAYDAMWALGLAMAGLTSSNNAPTMTSLSGKDLLGRIKNVTFEGLSGKFRLHEGVLGPAHVFQIVNVVGKRYREMGYWTENLGFSEKLGKGSVYNDSMSVLKQVFWPGGPWNVPRGWTILTSGRRLRIGVPSSNTHKEFVNMTHENKNGVGEKLEVSQVTGFSIDVFNETLKHLPYDLPHDFYNYVGTYDSMVQQIQLKKFDAVVGDTAIVAHRYDYVEFSQPYADSGLQMIIYVKPKKLHGTWLFKKPFTLVMWIVTGAVNVYNGFVVWLIERNHNPDFRGPIWNQIGTMLSLAFTTLFSVQGDRLHSNLSRMAMVVWLFAALVITQSFTASLTSFLTVEGLNQAEISVESLIRSGSTVGCDGDSFVVNYLQELGFKPSHIMRIKSEDYYSSALMRGEISAAFLEVPYVRVFLAKHCEGFTTSKQIFKVGGFGFAFPKNSPYIPDISKAVLELAESGRLRELENSMIAQYGCLSSESDDGHESLGINSFWGVFLVTVCTSTLSLIMFIFRRARDSQYRVFVEMQQHHDPREDEQVMFATELDYFNQNYNRIRRSTS